MPSINELSDVDIEAISVVTKGANRKRFFLRKKRAAKKLDLIDLPHAHEPIAKSDWSAVYCVVAEPGALEDPGMHGDQAVPDRWASEEEIRKAAHRFMRNGGLVNLMHKSLDAHGTLVENAIAQQDFAVMDPLGLPQTIKKGSWYIAFEPNEQAKAEIEKGTFGGISIQGTGTRTLVEKAGTFQESKHPRKGGKFAPKGTATVGAKGSREFAAVASGGGKPKSATDARRMALIRTSANVLRELGYSGNLAVALRDFQHKNGLPETGQPDPETMKTLRAKSQGAKSKRGTAHSGAVGSAPSAIAAAPKAGKTKKPRSAKVSKGWREWLHPRGHGGEFRSKGGPSSITEALSGGVLNPGTTDQQKMVSDLINLPDGGTHDFGHGVRATKRGKHLHITAPGHDPEKMPAFETKDHIYAKDAILRRLDTQREQKPPGPPGLLQDILNHLHPPPPGDHTMTPEEHKKQREQFHRRMEQALAEGSKPMTPEDRKKLKAQAEAHFRAGYRWGAPLKKVNRPLGHGGGNWITRLPEPLQAAFEKSWLHRVASHLVDKGKPVGTAIAIGVNAAKKACATGDVNFPGVQQINAGSKAEACASVALWESMKAASAASSGKVAKAMDAPETEDDVEHVFSELEKFSPSQLRGPDGRWISGGLSGGGEHKSIIDRLSDTVGHGSFYHGNTDEMARQDYALELEAEHKARLRRAKVRAARRTVAEHLARIFADPKTS